MPAMVQRWVLDDGFETYTFEVNPNQADALYPDRVYAIHESTALTGQTVLFEGRPAPTQWSYGGDIYTEEQYHALAKWTFLKNRIRITNHMSQVIYFQPQNFKPVPKRNIDPGTGGVIRWRHTYTVSGLVTRVEEPDSYPVVWGALPDGS